MKASILNEELKTKNSPKRKRIALVLNSWRKNHSWRKTAIETNLSIRQIQKSISHSKAYQKSKFREQEITLKEKLSKNSAYRNETAKYLLFWKKYRSMKLICEHFNQPKTKIYRMLSRSHFYPKRKTYTKSEKEYATIWSKKNFGVELLGGKCVSCGCKNIVVLEFHHEKEKDSSISDMLRKSNKTSMEKFKKEILKCVILCRNCHQELHHKISQNYQHKKEILRIHGSEKCQECGYNKNISCLEFHHNDPTTKKYKIGEITDPRLNINNLSRFKKEIRKCSVLCCNCHQMRHVNIQKMKNLNLLISIKTRLLHMYY
ncbi:MAG: hypothetical protein WC119_02215 [Synergistaceae bacterium]